MAPWMFFNSLSRSAPGEFLRVGEKGLQRGERGVWVPHLCQLSCISLELLRERPLYCFSLSLVFTSHNTNSASVIGSVAGY